MECFMSGSSIAVGLLAHSFYGLSADSAIRSDGIKKNG